jgi:integral membrane protein (TIGR01906 family)
MDYIRGQNQLEQNIFSLQAQIHLMEVKNLFSIVLVTNLFCVLVVLMTFSLLFLKKEINLIKYALFYSSVLTLAVILTVSVFTYINFYFWFLMFHRILFSDNLWLFEPNDILVKIFPAQFFSESLLLVSTNIVFCVIILLLTSKILTKNAR